MNKVSAERRTWPLLLVVGKALAEKLTARGRGLKPSGIGPFAIAVDKAADN